MLTMPLFVGFQQPCYCWLLKFCLMHIALMHVVSASPAESANETSSLGDTDCEAVNDTCTVEGCPLVPCEYVPDEFIQCDELYDWEGNSTKKEEFGYGCAQFGGSRYEEVERGNANCHVISCEIECSGERHFLRRNLPCVRYTGHYFLSTLLYSMFLGIVAMDRFCLGHNGVAVGKLLSLGGFGIWWIVDIFLLVTGKLTPADHSNWMPSY